MDSPQFLGDPQPLEWLSEHGRTERLHSCFDAAAKSLYLSGLIQPAIAGWIKQEVSASIDSVDETDASQTVASLVDCHSPADLHLQFGDSPQLTLSPQQQVIAKSCRIWSRNHWEHLLESLFLQKKDVLDSASCRLLRVKQRDLAHELFYRLQDQEASFEDLSLRYGVGPEAKRGGLLSLRRMHEMPLGLQSVLPTLAVGELSSPCKIGKSIGLIILEEYQPARLDEEVSTILLKMQFKQWLQSASSASLSLLNIN